MEKRSFVVLSVKILETKLLRMPLASPNIFYIYRSKTVSTHISKSKNM